LWTAAAAAQAPAKKDVPVEERGGPGGTALPQQQRTSAAYRALAQARYEAKLAEQDYVNASDAYRSAQQRADVLKENLEKLRRAREAAKEKEAAAAKAYDAELNAGAAR
jgi:hypothetical protein